MQAIRTEDGFVFIQNFMGERIGTYSMRSKIHIEVLNESVGKNVMDLLEGNLGKLIDIKTLEITDPK